MDVLMLSRLQFAVATFFHFIFVPLTLGLSLLTAIMETWYVSTGDETYKQMAKFWGRLFLINFALGVVTGITLEFQFGTNWSRYSAYVGDVFGPLLAIEATLAFFLESTFVGVWIFGWERVSKKLHLAAIWIVALSANMSAYWIIMANGFMQEPVGYVIRNGRAELEDFTALITHSFAISQFIHTLAAAYTLAGFFVLGVSAYHLIRRQHLDFFKRSFALAATWSVLFTLLTLGHGHHHGAEVARVQPTKLAAMESHWETMTHAPQYLFAIPDPANERNLVELLPIPSGLSMLAFHSPAAEVKGLKEWPKEDRPPVTLTFVSFRLMVALGFLMPLLALIAWFKRKTIEDYPRFLQILVYAIPLPYIAIQLGWIVAEVGRQPWIVYGMMRTSDAVSPITTGQVATSFVALVLLYTLLAALDIFLLTRFAKLGPTPAPLPGSMTAEGSRSAVNGSDKGGIR